MPIPIVDLHCDLLSYLAMGKGRTPHDLSSRASYPQLHAGGVQLQTAAIFAKTGYQSTHQGKKQVDLLCQLLTEYPLHFASYSAEIRRDTGPVQLIAAFENGAGFAEETEPLSSALERLEAWQKRLKHIFYLSLTWDGENRFGGGVGSPKGLKDDGKHLLAWMSGKQIAVDLSHTCDRLAEEILVHIEQEGLNLPVMASHSNFRAISPYPRNLPDWLAQEIIRRRGLIGLNFFAPFIHLGDPQALIRHVEYGLALGGQGALCFGADFFCDTDFPSLKQKYPTDVAFFPEYPDASCYPSLLQLLQDRLSLSTEQVEKLAYKNALAFLERSISK